MTGRGDEMSVLVGMFDRDSGPHAVVIAGGAGLGKTRLAREAAAAAAERDWVVRHVQGAAAGQAIPLGPFAQWIDQLDEQPMTVVSSVIAAVTASPGNKPVLIAVDDVHLLDDLSMFLLHQVIQRRLATVIATLRTGEAPPKSLTELWKDGHLRRLDLQPLSRQHCSALLDRALGGPVDAGSARRLWEMTRGNVLFMNELVRQELHAGRLVHGTDDRWAWTGSMALSPSLADLVEAHIGTASEQVLEVLDLVSVAEPLELHYLSALADPQAIEDAEQLELILIAHEAPVDLVRLGHPLYGEIRRARMGLMRARRLRGRIVDAMSSASVAPTPTDPVRLALLWLESDLPPDSRVHHRGAAAAFRRLDMALSERLVEAAIRAGAGTGRESRILQARTLSMVGRGEAAEELLAALPADDGSDALWVAAQILRALNLLLTLGRPAQSTEVIEDALSVTPPPLDQELLAFRALQLAMAARPTEVVALLDSIDRDQLTSESRINLNYGTTIAFGDLGRPDEATRTPEDELVLGASSSVNAFQAASLALIHVDALAVSGHIVEAMALSQRVAAQWSDLPKVPRTIAAALTGIAAVAHGDLFTARETLSAAMKTELLRQDASGLPFLGVIYWLRIAYADALARAGDADAAARALSETERNQHPSFAFLEPNRMLAAAWVAAARGRTTDAIKLTGEAADFARNHQQHAREVMCLQTAIQFGDTRGHTERLAELATLVEGPRAPLVARWAVARSGNDGEALMSVSTELEAMGDRLGAADAAAHAAQVFERRNLRGSRLTASARATRIIAECGAATPATREISAPLPLSKREREIAVLVRDGLSNKEIAEALTMSVRTVEGHIYRACNKAGVANRAELGELIKQFTP